MRRSKLSGIKATVSCTYPRDNEARLVFSYGPAGSTSIEIPVNAPGRRMLQLALGKKFRLTGMASNNRGKSSTVTLVFKESLSQAGRNRLDRAIQVLLKLKGFDTANIKCRGFMGRSAAASSGD